MNKWMIWGQNFLFLVQHPWKLTWQWNITYIMFNRIRDIRRYIFIFMVVVFIAMFVLGVVIWSDFGYPQLPILRASPNCQSPLDFSQRPQWTAPSDWVLHSNWEKNTWKNAAIVFHSNFQYGFKWNLYNYWVLEMIHPWFLGMSQIQNKKQQYVDFNRGHLFLL